jgi:hypothetical protein
MPPAEGFAEFTNQRLRSAENYQLIGCGSPCAILPQTDPAAARVGRRLAVVTPSRLAPIAAVPVALIILSNRHGADEEVAVEEKPVSFARALNCS